MLTGDLKNKERGWIAVVGWNPENTPMKTDFLELHFFFSDVSDVVVEDNNHSTSNWKLRSEEWLDVSDGSIRLWSHSA